MSQQEQTNKTQKTVIVIGGLSAGPSAAAKARREDEHAKILLFEKTADISYATCGIPYALSGKIKTRNKLIVVKPELLQTRFNIEMHLEEEVNDIDIEVQEVVTAKGRYHYDELVYAAGARPFVPPLKVEGENAATLDTIANVSTIRSLADFDRIKESLENDTIKHAVVLGGGLIGIETAENLHELGINTTVIEGADQILTQWSPHFAHFAETELQNQGIKVITGHLAQAVTVDGDRVVSVRTKDRNENETTIETDLLLLGVGIRPNTEILANKGAETLGNGALVVDQHMRTTLPNIYAAGDCAAIGNPITNAPSYLPLGTHSNKGGRACGINTISEGQTTYPGGYGTAIIKVFETTLARTGLSVRELQGKHFATTYIHANATAGYYPDPREMVLELTYDVDTGTLLSAEAFGEHGVDKRIDVLATAIYAGLKVEDLPNLDLAYAPPYSPAKDPVVVAGYVASNHRRHRCSPISAVALSKVLQEPIALDQLQLIDVRSAKEIERDGGIAGAINIELDTLRNRLADLDRNKMIYLYCAKGMRGYLGALILKQNGFEHVQNLAGGFKAWEMQGYDIAKT